MLPSLLTSLCIHTPPPTHWLLQTLRSRCGNGMRGALASPQCRHSMAQLVHDSAEQQRDEEVGQLTGGQIDTRDLQTREKSKTETESVPDSENVHVSGAIFCLFDLIFTDVLMAFSFSDTITDLCCPFGITEMSLNILFALSCCEALVFCVVYISLLHQWCGAFHAAPG